MRTRPAARLALWADLWKAFMHGCEIKIELYALKVSAKGPMATLVALAALCLIIFFAGRDVGFEDTNGPATREVVPVQAPFQVTLPAPRLGAPVYTTGRPEERL